MPRDVAVKLPILLELRWAVEGGGGFFRVGERRVDEEHLPEADGATVEITYFCDDCDAAAASRELACIASILTTHRGARSVHLTRGGTPDPARESPMSAWHWEIVDEETNGIHLRLGPQHVLSLAREDLAGVARDAGALGQCGCGAEWPLRVVQAAFVLTFGHAATPVYVTREHLAELARLLRDVDAFMRRPS